VSALLDAITVTGTESSETVSYKGSSKGAFICTGLLTNRNIDCFIYFSIIFNRNHLIQIGIVQRMIREYSLVEWFVRRQYQFYFVVCQPKLRLMESDYRKLQQSQDNNSVMQNQMQQRFAAAIHSNPRGKGIAYETIVKGAFRDPGEIIIVVTHVQTLCAKVFW
jgi:hypothetical protein